MARALELTSTRQLVEDLIRQGSNLASIESELVRAELSEGTRNASAGLRALAAGASLLLAGFIVLLAAACVFLMRLGVSLDFACLGVAVGAMAIGLIFMLLGSQALRPVNWMPKRSMAQLSSLLRRH